MIKFKNVNKFFKDLHVLNDVNLEVKQGEVVVVADKYGVRITDIITPSERMRRLSR